LGAEKPISMDTLLLGHEQLILRHQEWNPRRKHVYGLAGRVEEVPLCKVKKKDPEWKKIKLSSKREELIQI